MDPYYEWLGIPAEEQPPNHYRLLGINLFESNPQAIESAVNQRMAYLQQLSGDQDSVADAQRIMGEISRARLILLNKEKKISYDKKIASGLDALPEATETKTSSRADARADAPKPQGDRPSNRPANAQSPRTVIGPSHTLAAKRPKKQNNQDKPAIFIGKRLFLIAGAAVGALIIVFIFLVGFGNQKLEEPRDSEVAQNPTEAEEKKPTETPLKRRAKTERLSDQQRGGVVSVPNQGPPEAERKAKEEAAKQAQREAEEEAARKAKEEAAKQAQREAEEEKNREAAAGQKKRALDYKKLTEEQDKINLSVSLTGKIKIFTDQTGDKIQFVIPSDDLPGQINLELVGEFNQWLGSQPDEKTLELYRLERVDNQWRTKQLDQNIIFKKGNNEVNFKFRGNKKGDSGEENENWLPNAWDPNFESTTANLTLKKNKGEDIKTYILNQTTP